MTCLRKKKSLSSWWFVWNPSATLARCPEHTSCEVKTKWEALHSWRAFECRGFDGNLMWSSRQGGTMRARRRHTCSCARSCRCGWPTPCERSTCYLITCWASPPSGWSRNGEVALPEIHLIRLGHALRCKMIRFIFEHCPLTYVCLLIRYMQSFVELLGYENRKPEDPHALNEWVTHLIRSTFETAATNSSWNIHPSLTGFMSLSWILPPLLLISCNKHKSLLTGEIAVCIYTTTVPMW